MTDIIFNDTSLFYASINTVVEAKKAFEDFIAEVAAAIDERIVGSVIRSQGSLLDAEIILASGAKWSVFDWFSGSSIDPDVRRLILTLDNKVPTEMQYDLSAEDEQALMANEYFAGGKTGPKCFAFGFALHTGNIVASVPTHELWKNSSLAGCICLNGAVLRSGVVSHFSKFDHISDIKKVFGQQLFNSIASRADFIDQKEILFPNLQFSLDIDNQIKELSVRQIINLLHKLQKMQLTAEKWKISGSPIPEYQFSWRSESVPTMDKPNFRKAREFNHPAGGVAIFESHLDFSASHRIHFIEDTKNKCFVVGYVGTHLPTVLYPH